MSRKGMRIRRKSKVLMMCKGRRNSPLYDSDSIVFYDTKKVFVTFVTHAYSLTIVVFLAPELNANTFRVNFLRKCGFIFPSMYFTSTLLHPQI